MGHVVFVYGTLKRGYRFHEALKDEEFLGEAVTKPLYRLYDLGAFPALVESRDGVEVKGEVYRVGDECLKRLDRIEGHPSFYSRKPVGLKDSPHDNAIAYFLPAPPRGAKDCGESWPRRFPDQ